MQDAKFEYFIDQTNQRLDVMDAKLDRLISFRIMLIGASVTISTIVSIGFTLLEVWVLHK